MGCAIKKVGVAFLHGREFSVSRLENTFFEDMGTIALSTSGTSGAPKRISFNALERSPRGSSALKKRTWGVGYSLGKFASVNLILQALEEDSFLSVPISLSPEQVVSSFVEDKVNAISLTPTLFRMLSMSVGNRRLADLELDWLVFGGEYSRQDMLDTAKTIWPSARISHVYATSEDGYICSVSDGREGYPLSVFNNSEMSLSETGELYIEGRPTGDFWKAESGRCVFVGRGSDAVNVGGNMLNPFVLENLVLTLDGVDDALAYSKRNPLLGSVLCLDYVGPAQRNDIRIQVSAILGKNYVPSLINNVSEILTSNEGKRVRREKGSD